MAAVRIVATCAAVVLAFAATVSAAALTSRMSAPRSLLQGGTCQCLGNPSIDCPANLLCPAGTTFTLNAEQIGCTVGLSLTAPDVGQLGPPGCTPPIGNEPGLTSVTHVCGGHDVIRSSTYCVTGQAVGGGDPNTCKKCDTVTFSANCDVAVPGHTVGQTPADIGYARTAIDCPGQVGNSVPITCSAAGDVIDLNALGCTLTNNVGPPGPLFFWNSAVQDCDYYYANVTGTLTPTYSTITCTQEMVDGLGCSYAISGLPPVTGCLNKAGSSTYAKANGGSSGLGNPAGCAVPATPPAAPNDFAIACYSGALGG